MAKGRERTFNAVHMDIFNPMLADGKYQIPIVLPTDHIPTKLIAFNSVKTAKDTECGVHFFIDDYQFERLWRSPELYINRLKQFDCVLTPDFSLYTDMSIATQIWNVYRSRLLGQLMQAHGIKVIPTLQWSTKESYEFCFDGLKQGGTVAVSTIGVKRYPDATQLWKDGMTEAIKRLKPDHIILYGEPVEYDFGNIDIIRISNTITAWRTKENGR